MNVDQEEVAHFDGLAEEWWDPHGELRTLHHLNPARLGYVEHRSGGVDGCRVVDVGCGGGILTEALARAGAHATGIDLSEQGLAAGRRHALETRTRVEYECVSAEDFASRQAGTFDIVTCLELLEHVPDPASTVAACATLVRSGGHVFFSTINRTVSAYLGAVVGAEYVLRLLPRGTHDYQRFIRPSELDDTARALGLCLQDVAGLHYNPLTRVARVTRDPRINYLAHFTRN
ncbi:MAG: bifunctional 2-polyprenyl-6-hydroxyphenol methylase/3-demethylubiquinol 3-O-methyltransferase UbiG [Chromatiales bacterium]|nr:bifunctional 2-polyprenyl-6-hydroxyphenol methylase/3-demethylubiquinol 3-O-methyltransferase UbiG [Chromatiales bacterium]